MPAGKQTKLTDKEAKQVFIDRWPRAPEILFGPADLDSPWLRCQPRMHRNVTHPRLVRVGSRRFKTQPDAMYTTVSLSSGYVDVVAVEVCGDNQNLNDKRSRYTASTGSLVVSFSKEWWQSKCYARKSWWEKAGLDGEPCTFELPVRLLRVLYFLENVHYGQVIRGTVPEAHEFFAPHSSIKSITGRDFRVFMARLGRQSHFCGRNAR